MTVCVGIRYNKPMKRWVLWAWLLVVLSHPLSAQFTSKVPDQVVVDVVLRHSQSGLLSGSKTVFAKVFDADTNTTIVEKTVSVTFNSGLGSIPLDLPENRTLLAEEPTLRLIIDGDVIDIPIVSTFYALQSRYAEQIRTEGNIGIGTTSPDKNLP